jgi:hypothetical protein
MQVHGGGVPDQCRDAAEAQRAVETGLSVLEDLTGSYLLKQQIPE